MLISGYKINKTYAFDYYLYLKKVNEIFIIPKVYLNVNSWKFGKLMKQKGYGLIFF